MDTAGAKAIEWTHFTEISTMRTGSSLFVLSECLPTTGLLLLHTSGTAPMYKLREGQKAPLVYQQLSITLMLVLYQNAPNALPYLGTRLPSQGITQRSFPLNCRILDVLSFLLTCSVLPMGKSETLEIHKHNLDNNGTSSPN